MLRTNHCLEALPLSHLTQLKDDHALGMYSNQIKMYRKNVKPRHQHSVGTNN
jgi:hypothetical protein